MESKLHHLQDVGWGDVDFCDDNDNGYFECDGETEMLPRHPRDAHVRPDQDEAVV